MAATTVTITPDTTIFTTHKDFAGWSMYDGILGDVSPAEYVRTSRGDAEDIAGLCEWLGGMIGEGFWLSEEAADAFLSENESWGGVPEIRSFTPASIHAEIMEMGKSDIEKREHGRL